MKNFIKKICNWICNIKADKLLHFIAGLLMAQIMCVIMNFIVNGYTSIIIGFIFSCVVCAAKEIVYDLLMKRGTPSIKDFIFGFIGALLGTIIIYFCF